MRIMVESFDPDDIAEAFDDYGIEGRLVYVPGDQKGKFIMQNGSYEFVCHEDSCEIELTELSIEVEEIVDNTVN